MQMVVEKFMKLSHRFTFKWPSLLFLSFLQWTNFFFKKSSLKTLLKDPRSHTSTSFTPFFFFFFFFGRDG